MLKIDANGNIRLKDLIDYIDTKLVEYAIPKKDIDLASRYLQETGSPAKIIELKNKANALFTDLEKTGEGGEILLYILTQEFLKLPQLLSKMSLKTSGQLHFKALMVFMWDLMTKNRIYICIGVNQKCIKI